ncbi:MAG TPA: hypothetical protein VK177_04420 [Flavobacteriales bacterium]|nr:hypothetical protein [Flavobacteriales bacterium]
MKEYIPIIADVSSIVLSVTALFFTYRVFKRENTINNENFIYQKKFDSHNALFVYCIEYMDSAEQVGGWLKQIQKEDTPFSRNEHKKYLEMFVKIENGLEIELLKHTLIIPEHILKQYHEFLYGPSPWNDLDNIEKWDLMTDHFYTKLEHIHQLVSEDLHIQKLNTNMISRFGTSRKNKLATKP